MLTWKMACASTASPYVMRGSSEIFIVKFIESSSAYWRLSALLFGDSSIVKLPSRLHIYIPFKKSRFHHT